MNFEEAVKEHNKGNDVYLESDHDWFWNGGSVVLEWTNKSRNQTRWFKDSDIHATDWAVGVAEYSCLPWKPLVNCNVVADTNNHSSL